MAKAEAAINRYESEELIVAARIPAMTTPARIAGSKDSESTIKTFSAELAVFSVASTGKSARPMRPIDTAANSEMMTHTVAMRRIA